MKLKIKSLVGLMATILLLSSWQVKAGTLSSSFSNEFETDAIYLFLYDDNNRRDVIFQDVSLNNPNAWSITEKTNTYLHLSGPDAGPGAVAFDITFSDERNARTNIIDFRIEWAEYLNGQPSESGAMGSLLVERNGQNYNWAATSDFSSTVPTPLPASTWLLMSGIFFLVGVRRHTRR